MALLQWNPNGFHAHVEELQVLVSDFSPVIFCLQETKFRTTESVTFKNYTLYRTDFPTAGRACGGVAIGVVDSVHSAPVHITTNLQAVAVRVHLQQQLTILNLYITRDQDFTLLDLQDLLQQLPQPVLVVGDFNSYNVLWGSARTEPRGRTVADFIDASNLVLLNTGAYTHFSLGNGSYSAIDLSLASPVVAPLIDWRVHDDLCGSDHFPIILEFLQLYTVPRKLPHWHLKRADWRKFETRVHLEDQGDLPVNDMVVYFNRVVLGAARIAIPQSGRNPRKRSVPWWNNELEIARRQRNRAFRTFNQYPTPANLNAVRQSQAHIRRLMKQSRRTSFRAYVTSVNSQTPIKAVWDRVRRLQGHPHSEPLSALLHQNVLHTDPEEIANIVGAAFAAISSSAHYSPAFAHFKRQEEGQPLRFQSNNLECYNAPFSEWELNNALRDVRNTSPGLDQIHYEMLRHLPSQGKAFLLTIYNTLWRTDSFPDCWREAIVIPILKPDKDKLTATNYRPIALTSCVCKLFERMVNQRLMWYLESHNFLSNDQCGFRRYRSTLDHLVRLESIIQNAFLRNEHVISVFFDLEKAYDTTWRYGILRQLHDWGIRGHMAHFLSNFLNDRYFRVRVGDCLSERYLQENGVPQGSVLSVTLFAVAVNSVMSRIRAPVQGLLYVDDLTIVCSSRNLNLASRQIQLTLNRLVEWSDQTGFRFSPTKTVCVHFCRQRRFHLDPDLFLGDRQLEFVNEVRYLGLHFDSKLNWRYHIRNIKISCLRALNLLRVLSHPTWGSDRRTLLRLYRALILSKLLYGCQVYSSARFSVLRLLDTVHHTGIRLSTGAYRTSPVTSLCVDAAEPPLELHRMYHVLRYYTKLSSLVRHPAHSLVVRPVHRDLYDRRGRCTRPLGIRTFELLEALDADHPTVCRVRFSLRPPWTLVHPRVDLSLSLLRKAETSFIEFQQRFLEMQTKYPNFVSIFTDGSKSAESVGCAFVVNGESHEFCLNSKASIFTAELYAILQALDFSIVQNFQRILVCTDSLSVLQSLEHMYSKHPLVQDVFCKMHVICSHGGAVVFAWIPSHVGIRGNELADQAARAASLHAEVDIQHVPFQDMVIYYLGMVRNEWQRRWDDVAVNKLRPIKATVAPWMSSCRANRREEILLCRLRIGHSRLTHGYLLRRLDPPRCSECNGLLSIRHIVLECPGYDHLRQRYRLPNELASLLGDDCDAVRRLLLFVRETGLSTSF
jgi:ribonuclease HI/exonuclease III